MKVRHEQLYEWDEVFADDPLHEVMAKVEKVYEELGAKVIKSVSYAGEDPVSLYIPDTTPNQMQ